MTEKETGVGPQVLSRRRPTPPERSPARTQHDLEPILVSKKESAGALGVSIRTVENLIARKELPARKIGKRTLIPYRALLDFARRDHPTREVHG